MSLELGAYAPVILPINWQSELVENNESRYELLKVQLSALDGITVKPSAWPMGYGSLEHDNLPVLYQPAAVLNIDSMVGEADVNQADLYIYDNCLAVLYVRLRLAETISTIDDLAVSRRIQTLSEQYLSPILQSIYEIEAAEPMLRVSDYTFFPNDQDELTGATPLWVARMLTQNKKLSVDHYQGWLKKIDAASKLLQLGSGNSLLAANEYYLDVHRVMVMAQFHAALMYRIESVLKDNLKQLNSNYYKQKNAATLNELIVKQQYRNDHIEFIDIQVSAASAGVQGERRELLSQFYAAWGFDQQHQRIVKLTQLTQSRLDRLAQQKLTRQNRKIQTLLTFLGALGLIGLVVDLIDLENEVEHSETIGFLDLINLASPEITVNLMFVVALILTVYFYRNHE